MHLPLSCRAVDTEQRFVSTKHLPLGLKPCETQLNPSVVSKVSHSLRFSQKSTFYVDPGSAAAELMEMHMQACILLSVVIISQSVLLHFTNPFFVFIFKNPILSQF